MRYLLAVVVFTFSCDATADVSISKLSAPVTVDGDLSDDGWRNMPRIESFVEYYRGDNTAPPAKTISYLAYDAASVYVAFLAEDPAPKDIRAPLVDRDKVMGDQDYVAILIDTNNDRRAGVAFRVNPRGVQTDSVVNDASGNEDFSPDFFYEAVAKRTTNGWIAEMRIPMSSLRYPAGGPQQWGVILMRNYPRDFRYIMSNTPIPKSSGCFLCHATTVSGFDDLPTGSHFTLTPYTTSTFNGAVGSQPTEDDGGLRARRSTLENDAGFDLKWNPSTRLTIDATLNPDFSQIEADVPQIDVNNRFALSYPEKRSFFLESVDLLDTPIRAVYTRSVNSPAWGMRATGRSGASAYTFLLAEDRGGGVTIIPGAQGSDFIPQGRSRVAFGRLRRSFGESFGAVLASARENEDGGHNRILGPDFLWKRSATDKIAGQLLLSDTDGESGHAYRVYFQRDAKRYDIWAATSGYSPAFRADNGFVVQNALRRAGAWVGIRTYPKNFFSYFRPYAGIEHDATFEGTDALRTGFYPGFYFEGKWNSRGWANAMLERERVGTRMLERNAIDFDVQAAPRRWLPLVQLTGNAGQKIDYAGARVGNGALLNLGTTVRASDHIELQLTTSREWLDLDEGRLFSANINWLKTTYTFSPRSLARAIVQQSDITRNAALYPTSVRDRERRLSLSALYAYKLNFQTVFFVGFGDASSAEGREKLACDARSVFMKVAYAIQR